jgi:hypothetical protein
MRRRTIVLAALVLTAFLLPAELVSAQGTSGALEPPIGKVVAVEGTATIEHTAVVVVQAATPRGPINAKVGDVVYIGDLIQTGANGKINLVFADGTALNVLSNARMELNEFVYNPATTVGQSTFNLVKGTFTFVGGKMANTGRMRVNTPAATMGIRGTTAHVVVEENGTTRFSTLIEEKH